MSALPSIEEYRSTMSRIARVANRLRSYAADRCWIAGGLSQRAMDDALELERRVKSALEPFGLDAEPSANPSTTETP
jgi:hypothetical protein